MMLPILDLEEVFRPEGVPEFTFVAPPNYTEILLDVRRVGKPVILEGQSGAGKTTCVQRIIEELGDTRPKRIHNPKATGSKRRRTKQLAACGGDMKSAIRALILANEFLEWELATSVTAGYLRSVKYGRVSCNG
jgi:hypothetical protein